MGTRVFESWTVVSQSYKSWSLVSMDIHISLDWDTAAENMMVLSLEGYFNQALQMSLGVL